MSVILIQNASGESSVRELSKQLPVAVGRHSSNDIQVSEPDVNILHCRISWNREAYEVIAGTETGVVINGTSVPSATLTAGDCIQVGTFGIFYYDNTTQLDAVLRGEPVETVSGGLSDSYPVQPVQRTKKSDRGEPTSSKRDRDAEPRRRRRSKRQETSLPRVRRKVQSASTESVEDFPLTDIDNQPVLHRERYIEQPVLDSVPPGPVRIFDKRPVRPGEQDPLRSPLVLTLAIGTAVLIMVSLALWFVIGRDTSNKAYQLAIEEIEQKRYTQAITQLTEFLKIYPNHRLASAARHALGLSQVEQAIAGAAPDWTRAMESLNQYIDERKRDTDFPDMAPQISELAERLAKGAAETAGVLKQPELLQITTEATRVLQTYSPADTPPKQALTEIDESVKKATLAIRQHEAFQTALEQIDKALKEKHPFAAFEVRRKLLLKYPSLESDSSLKSRMTKLLDAERKLTIKAVLDQPAQTTESPLSVDNSALFLTRQSRTRPDTMASGTNVFTLVHETCVAVDSATSAIQWRRVVGLDTPFPPHAVQLDVLGLLLFNVQRSELLLVRQRDGGLIWRQVLPDPASAAPLVHAGQIFIPTRGGKLCQLDLVTGKLLSTLAFSQPLAASPVLVQNGERLIIAGDRAVLYTLNYRPLECLSVTYSGHPAGSIQAPLLKMGDFLLVEENDRQDSALLRVWNLPVGDQPLVPLTSSRIEGQTREAAILRGKQLVVPSSPERLSSFTVSDEKGERALTPAGTYAVDSPRGGAITVTLGPEDELWMTSSSLRRFQIGPDSLVPDKGQLSLGISTQPAQVIGQNLFATSRVPSNSAVSFLAADRRDMVSQWQLVLGGRAITAGAVAANDGSIPLLLDTGDVFSITTSKLQAGGIETRPVASLPLPPGLKNPLQAALLANGRLAAWCDGPQPVLWQLNSDGIVSRESKLPGQLEAAPIQLSGGVLLPLAGKLKLIEAPGFTAAVEDLMPPVDPKQATHWRTILPIDDKQFIAINDQGRILRAQVRVEPVPHLAEVTSFDLKQRVDRAPVSVGSKLFVDTEQSLNAFDVTTLESRGSVKFDDRVSQGPWAVEGQVVLVCGRDQLIVVDIEPKLAIRWTQKLADGSLAGPPLVRKDQLILATHSGQVFTRKPATGELIKSTDLGHRLTYGPFLVQDQVVVATQDGSLKSLNAWLEAQP